MGPNHIYVPALAFGVYALDKLTGVQRWNFRPGATFKATPAYDALTNTVLAGADNGVLYKLNADTGAVLGTFTAGTSFSYAPLIAAGFVYAASDSGTMYKVEIATMSQAWAFVPYPGAYPTTSAAYSSTRDVIIWCTADLNVYAVHNVNGSLSWRVKPSGATPADRTTFAGYWPVIAEQHGIVFVRMNLDGSVVDAFYGPGYGGKYPNTNAETRAFLQANPLFKNLFALSLDSGQEAFVPAVGFGGTEGLVAGRPVPFTPPVPVVKVVNGVEVAYCHFRNGQTADIQFLWDYRWDSHLGEMVLDDVTLPGYVAGDLRFIDFANSYVHITDEQNPLSMAGNTIFHNHWGALESTRILNRSSGLGDVLINPITSQAHPIMVRGQQASADYNPATHWTTNALKLYSDGRYWNGPGWWTYWNIALPLSPLAGAFSVGLGPRYTYAADGLVVVEGGGGELMVFSYTGGPPPPTPVITSVNLSHVGSDTNPVGTSHTVQVQVLDQNGQPMAGVPVTLNSAPQQPPSVVSNLSDNISSFPNGQVPRYSKLELTFNVDTPAANPQFPFDPSPPPGVQVGIGVSVDGLFSRDDWATVYTVPGFLYQAFSREHHNDIGMDLEVLYPQGDPVWKIRFAPSSTGVWRYRLRVTDARGTFFFPSSGDLTFNCSASSSKGFLRVSPTDRRYFEFSDGSPAVLLGTAEGLDPGLQTYDLDARFAEWDKANFFRIWMSGSSLVGSMWQPWLFTGGHSTALSHEQVYCGLFSIKMSANMRMWQQGVPVRPNTTYKVNIRYRCVGVTGPATAGLPFGLVVKTSQGGADNLITPYVNADTGWSILSGTFTAAAAQYFIGWFTLSMENTTGGAIYIDNVSVREDLGGGILGHEMLRKGSPNYHLYFDQAQSWDWDYILDACAARDVYLKLVVLEKNDDLYNHIDANGNYVLATDNNNFYSAPGRAVRRYHEYFWRYLAARWGYSTAVHSWELLNEGDPYNGNHYNQAEAFAATMHALESGRHMVTTSMWTSFPASEFWGNAGYPNVDYADLHAYISTGGLNVVQPDGRLDYDSALYTEAYSLLNGAYGPSGSGKPIVRGEAGIDYVGNQTERAELALDTTGVWLHNYLWGQLNPGGMYDLYWWMDNIRRYNLWPVFRPLSLFLNGIPLNSGRYADAQAITSDPGLRAWGQKDLASGRAHLWIANKAHTWKNVVDGVGIAPVSGTVIVPGLAMGSYAVEWWDPYNGVITRRETIVAEPDGLPLLVPPITTDVAVKVSPA